MITPYCILSHRSPMFTVLGLGVLILLVACKEQQAPGLPKTVKPETNTQGRISAPATFHSRTDYALSHNSFYTGSCDGSGAVALDADHFIVANDETSKLLVFHRYEPGPPLQTVNIRKSLDLKKNEEADLEAMARIEDRIYLIGSHARGRDGKKEKERRKLVGIQIQRSNTGYTFHPVGDAYEDLLDDLTGHPGFATLKLKSAARASGNTPDALNIEGLCAAADGSLWLCFRGPRIGGRALLIPLLNPEDALAGAKARFGLHVPLDLHERPIRGADNFQGQILLIADGNGKDRPPALYRWDGQSSAATQLTIPEINILDPESILLYPDTGLQSLQILSDDGNRRLIEKDCKDSKDASQKRFRSATYTWEIP